MPVCSTPATSIAPGTVFSSLLRLSTLLVAASLSIQTGFAASATLPAAGLGQCRNLNLTMPPQNGRLVLKNPILDLLEKFERSFADNDSTKFAELASDSLQKKKDELRQIFDGTILEYDLQKTRLQRNSIWELNLGENPSPGKTLRCGENEIQPVYGPTKQIAVIYSTFSSNQQTRILVLFANTALDAQKTAGLGLVLLQVQRWTYDGRSPEKLLAEGLQHSSTGDVILGQLLSEAAAKILETNPYLIPPLQKTAREQADRLASQAIPLHSIKLKPLQTDPLWTPDSFVPVFKDGSLAIGLKIRMKNEIAFNEQAQKCLETSKKISEAEPGWRNSFSGVECMPYQLGENMKLAPKGGSQYFPWTKLVSK